MPTPTPSHVRLRIVCDDPPPALYQGQPTEFGLQDKQQTLHSGAQLQGGALAFSCEVVVKPHNASNAPDFSGSFVHGPAGSRFLYLGWRPIGGAWIKRFKIPLAPIDWHQVTAGQASALAAHINTTRSGTVALLGAGWAASEES